MALPRTVGRFLAGTLGVLVVAWPAVSNFVLSALGVSIIAFPAVDQAWVEAYGGLWRTVATGATVVLALGFGGVFAVKSYSLGRFAAFVLATYPLALALGTASKFVLGSLLGPFLGSVSQPVETTLTAAYSFLTFVAGAIAGYYVAYGASYDRLLDR